MKHTPIEFTTLTEYMDPAHNNTDFQLFSLAVTEAQFPDPYGYFHTDNNKEGGMNTSRVDANSALGIQTDEKIDAVRAAETADEYRAAYREYLKFMNKEMTILPMYANDYHDLFRSDVDNFKTPADVN